MLFTLTFCILFYAVGASITCIPVSLAIAATNRHVDIVTSNITFFTDAISSWHIIFFFTTSKSQKEKANEYLFHKSTMKLLDKTRLEEKRLEAKPLIDRIRKNIN